MKVYETYQYRSKFDKVIRKIIWCSLLPQFNILNPLGVTHETENSLKLLYIACILYVIRLCSMGVETEWEFTEKGGYGNVRKYSSVVSIPTTFEFSGSRSRTGSLRTRTSLLTGCGADDADNEKVCVDSWLSPASTPADASHSLCACVSRIQMSTRLSRRPTNG